MAKRIVRGILFSGTKENVELALKHIKEHGIVYWCLGVGLKYEKYCFPIIGPLHVKDEGVHYKCIITDIMPFSSCHFKYPKKKPTAWIEEQQIEEKKYKTTLAISESFSEFDLKQIA